MAFPDPASIDQFQRRMKIAEMSLDIEEFAEISGTAGGDLITREVAAPKWTASVTLSSRRNSDAREARALLSAVGVYGRFHIFDTSRKFPAADPDGSILGSAAPTLHTVGSNGKSLRVAGLPSGYVLGPGDLLCFSRDVRHALHEVVETATASAGGLTGTFEVRPHLRLWTIAGLAVDLKRPSALMRMRPGGVSRGAAGPHFRSAMSFAAIEAR